MYRKTIIKSVYCPRIHIIHPDGRYEMGLVGNPLELTNQEPEKVLSVSEQIQPTNQKPAHGTKCSGIGEQPTPSDQPAEVSWIKGV